MPRFSRARWPPLIHDEHVANTNTCRTEGLLVWCHIVRLRVKPQWDMEWWRGHFNGPWALKDLHWEISLKKGYWLFFLLMLLSYVLSSFCFGFDLFDKSFRIGLFFAMEPCIIQFFMILLLKFSGLYLAVTQFSVLAATPEGKIWRIGTKTFGTS